MSEIPEGYKVLAGANPAEDHIGPFYYRKSEQGVKLGFVAREHNCNGLDSVYGGVLMAFADYTATMVALAGVQENCSTVSFSGDFVARARLGDWVEGEAEVIRRTGSLSFLSGRLHVGGETVLVFQTVMRRLKKPDA